MRRLDLYILFFSIFILTEAYPVKKPVTTNPSVEISDKNSQVNKKDTVSDNIPDEINKAVAEYNKVLVEYKKAKAEYNKVASEYIRIVEEYKKNNFEKSISESNGFLLKSQELIPKFEDAFNKLSEILNSGGVIGAKINF